MFGLKSLFVVLNFMPGFLTEKAMPDINACQNQLLLLGSENNMAKVIDATLGVNIKLECNFCGVQDNFQPKIWYYKKRGDRLNLSEIPLEMDNNVLSYKHFVTPSHVLDIMNFTINDSGIYTCKPYNHENEESIFTYMVDDHIHRIYRMLCNVNARSPVFKSLFYDIQGVFNIDLVPKFGKIGDWQEYKRTTLDPINRRLEISTEYIFAELRDKYNLNLRLTSLWDNWGKCEKFGRSIGIRRKLGKCCLYPIPHNSSEQDIMNDQDVTRYYLIDNYHVSCRSITLNSTFPEISKIVRSIPNFEATESCNETFPSVKGGSTGKKKIYKYKMSKHLAENSHITLTCPEVTLDSTVEWFKDKQLLNSSFRNNMAESEEEPHLSIDAYNNLYILHATKNEEAVYYCKVDGKNIQKFDIRIVAKSKVLNQEFIRYSIYLGFVLSLTLSCYCAGICVAWRRRASFADPLMNVKYEKDNADDDVLLNTK